MKITSDRDALVYLLGQYDRLLQIHRLIAMDTPEDRKLHDQVVAAAHDAAGPIRDLLAETREATP